MDEAIGSVTALATSQRFTYVVTPNVDHVVKLHGDDDAPWRADFHRAYTAAERVYCDSRILALLADRRGIPLPVVAGSDLTAHLFAQVFAPTHRIAVIGGSAEMIAALLARFPTLSIQHHEPPMGLLANPSAQAQVVDFVRTAQADFTLFAIGAPQSEIIALRCLEDGGCRGVALCIGASIEFIIGAKQRAPLWMQRMKLEWLFRLASEPRRLWRRYLVEGPRIFALYRAEGQASPAD